MLKSLTEEQESSLVQFLVNKYQAYAVVLFGSAAREGLREDSDVDIAYLSNTRTSSYDRFKTAQQLSDMLKRDVDLIDFFEASTVFQAQIVAHGKLLYDSEPVLRQTAYMVSLKSYALLNEERFEILEQFDKESGG